MPSELPPWALEMAGASTEDERFPSAIDQLNFALNRMRLASFLTRFFADQDVRDLLSLDVLGSAAGLPLSSTGLAEIMPDLITRPFRIWEYAWLYKSLRLKEGGRKVLDLGGPASHLSLLAALAGCEVTSLDINPVFVRAAQECARALGLSTLDAQLGDMRDLSVFSGESFDVVVCCSVLEHLTASDQEIALRGMARVLKPDGVIGLTFDFGPGAPGANEHLPPPHDPPPNSTEALRRYLQPGLVLAGNPSLDDPIPGSLFINDSIHYTVASLFLTKTLAREIEVPQPEPDGATLENVITERLPHAALFAGLRAQAETLRATIRQNELELKRKDAVISEVFAEGEERSKGLERAVATIDEQDQRSAALERTNAERMAAMQEKDAAIANLHGELDRLNVSLDDMRAQLERAVATVNEQDQRSAALERTNAERMAAMQEKDAAIADLHGELDRLNASLNDMRAQLERAVAAVREQDQRAGVLEQAAADRLAGMQEKERAIRQLHAEIDVRDAALNDLRAQLERVVAAVREQEGRAGVLEQAAADRLAGMQEKERAITQLHAEIDVRDAALNDLRAQLERAVAVVREQEGRAGVLEQAAADRLAAMEEKDQTIARLGAELDMRAAARS